VTAAATTVRPASGTGGHPSVLPRAPGCAGQMPGLSWIGGPGDGGGIGIVIAGCPAAAHRPVP
jgi:hypothetical protein